MNHLNNSLATWASTLKRDSSFSLILAFDYYDGPESGVAFFASGEGVRFSSLGDSRSRHFRAFELLSICGNWGDQVRAIQSSTDMQAGCQIFFPPDADSNFLAMEKAVSAAEVSAQYIGIGSPNFDWLYVVSVTNEEVVEMRQLASTQARFDQAHRLLKRNKRERHT